MDELQVGYCNEVLRFRKVLNLTSIKDLHVFYHTFITPSVALEKWIPPGSVILDIGSGMGVPGIPLLIHREDVSGVLVERRKKRTEFIRHVIRKLKLNAVAYDADIYDLEPLNATVCVARAVSEVKVLLDMCAKHIVDGGRAVLPIPNDVMLPEVQGWQLQEDFSQEGLQRIACYLKQDVQPGGVSRET
jgi:16S rRNA (guanine527-N7)-methyltransferase